MREEKEKKKKRKEKSLLTLGQCVGPQLCLKLSFLSENYIQK